MPQWDYKCTDCGRVKPLVFMNWKERDAAEQTDHETNVCACGGQLERQSASGSFKLVGAGFHANDYPREQK